MSKIVLNKDLLNVVPFQVDGNNILVKDVDDEVLVVLPNQPNAILNRSQEINEFIYYHDDLEVVFTNYDTEGDANLDFYALQNILATASPSGTGGATADNQLLEIEALNYIVNNTDGLNTNVVKRGNVTPDVHVVGTTAVNVLPSNGNRSYLTVLNKTGAIIDISIDSSVSPTNSVWAQIPNNAEREFDVFVPTNEIWVRARSGSGNVYVTTF